MGEVEKKMKLKRNGKKRISWTIEMENQLLDLWEENISDLRGSRKNAHIYREMAQKMSLAENDIMWSDVKSKMDNLTLKYRAEKRAVGPSGGSPSTWTHFPKMQNILGGFKPFNLSETTVESTDFSSLLESLSHSTSPTNTNDCSYTSESVDPPPPKKAKTPKKDEYAERMLKLSEERTERIAALTADTMKFHSAMLKLFEEHLNNKA